MRAKKKIKVIKKRNPIVAAMHQGTRRWVESNKLVYDRKKMRVMVSDD